MRKNSVLILLALGLSALTACQKKGLPSEEALKLVRAYNERVTEAYRTGDPMLVAMVAGPKEQKKLLGLIGAKTDMGFNLDARLTEFKVLKVEPREKEVAVFTEERWAYRDRKIGTGAQVGEASSDHYFMTYLLRQPEGRWVVDEITFTNPPEVGRTATNNRASAEVLHGAGSLTETGLDAAEAQRQTDASRKANKKEGAH